MSLLFMVVSLGLIGAFSIAGMAFFVQGTVADIEVEGYSTANNLQQRANLIQRKLEQRDKDYLDSLIPN